MTSQYILCLLEHGKGVMNIVGKVGGGTKVEMRKINLQIFHSVKRFLHCAENEMVLLCIISKHFCQTCMR